MAIVSFIADIAFAPRKRTESDHRRMRIPSNMRDAPLVGRFCRCLAVDPLTETVIKQTDAEFFRPCEIFMIRNG